ncbi:nucleotidyltransferase family protein [bacterium]|nr:nucleotidyltransferase family protein [bacterium]MBU1753527.1 nucleotidyltransferase family protein [bacterium]
MQQKPEVQLLLYFTRAKIDTNTLEDIYQLLDAPINWDEVLSLSLKHRIAPLLYHHLTTSIVPGKLPRSIMPRLKEIYTQNFNRNKQLYDELHKIATLFHEADVEVLVLKGPILARLIYPSIGVRCMKDIDLVIKEEHWLRAKECFLSLGYSLPETLPELDVSELVKYTQYFSQIEFTRKGCIPIEPHFRLFNMGIPMKEPWLFEHVRTMDKALIPSPEILLLHLCIHANTHNFCSLMLLCDIGAVVQHYGDELDGSHIQQIAATRGITCSVYNSLILTEELLNIPIPERLKNALKIGFIRQMMFNIVWNKPQILSIQKTEKPPQLEAPAYYLLEMDNILDRLKYLCSILFPPLKWLAAYFKVKATPLSYPIYLIRYLLHGRGKER